MKDGKEKGMLRIYLGESDQAGGRPLYETIVLRAREQDIAGATVLRGPMGFGKSSRLHTAKILRLSQDLPIVIEIVDEREKLKKFIQGISPILGSALVTLEKIEVLRYGK